MVKFQPHQMLFHKTLTQELMLPGQLAFTQLEIKANVDHAGLSD